ncbi:MULTISPECIES: ABC transporter ATP-binding protein [Eubacteriales]|uniref:ABC transport system ATP-binding protein n=1 Tax=Bittarella massiliensis (ex Durand et al. 2017) TaxID=1720313 RepID=A0AAQ1RWF6_9FIRM|nr:MULTISPECIES: ABC transporter ATP-binding protein [Eubacteriales]ERI99017.1 ABC transporter, ATP-binding protein [Clostridium sp. ATCC 29733]MZL70410.1 ATP-binding cassette domain-containing protein [Bittarella massiliensis (ex Durand et al. 2017)]MZL80357.1 ATP-binding cassette domain-containing protein [Bittarella massiliensis (ex Durand et al. 2017)]SHG32653.1 putative ABC transport system ATP-binding protein [Bittarella massiliensis (ex Durand et al. 2017)]
MELLRVENLCKHYGGRETGTDALKGVSFTVEKGEFVAIVGPSGSGKSTLLHILGGVDRPTSGRVLVDGADVYQMDENALAIFRRRQIGLIYQFYNLIPVLNVEENITLPLLLDGRKVDPFRLQNLVEKLGLGERLGHLPSQLSGGQQQRVSIGRALIASPALVLADEPTGNLDSKNSGEIIGLLRDFHRTLDQTLLIITHDERIALQADRIIAIEDGQIAQDEVIRR